MVEVDVEKRVLENATRCMGALLDPCATKIRALAKTEGVLQQATLKIVGTEQFFHMSIEVAMPRMSWARTLSSQQEVRERSVGRFDGIP
ncbi:hypothetical protein E2C01_085285 [Portunus trituberculatus]|uniref:Uncharacterized protein n=1 Tax=Portunus trituberculatus TaxID=210409 RepID=A0A5B7JBI3_PORTR|nr:hypothetical protein [Portunus trituberculatus]